MVHNISVTYQPIHICPHDKLMTRKQLCAEIHNVSGGKKGQQGKGENFPLSKASHGNGLLYTAKRHQLHCASQQISSIKILLSALVIVVYCRVLEIIQH